MVKTKNSKRKIVKKESLPVSTGVGGESREGDIPKPNKTIPHASDDRGLLDFSFLSEINKYDRRGPFDVTIQSPDDSSSSIDPINIGRLLYSISKKDIVEIRKIGYSINVQLKSREAANNLVTNPILKAKKYKVFIPLYRTIRRGIIRNVPLDLSKEEIRRGIDSEVVVSSIKRLNRRKRNSDSSLSDVVDGDSRLTPSNTV